MSLNHYRVGVIGSGAWGTALAVLANRAGSKVTFATRNPNVLETIRDHRVNETYLPGIFIDPRIDVTDSIQRVCQSDLVIVAVPSQVLRSICILISDALSPSTPVVIASKGIERGSLMLMSEIAGAVLPKNPLAILSGPNFADEAARGMPTATSIACADKSLWDTLSYALGGRLFRPYMSDDLIGTQIGGAVKNVIAIACGITIGKGLGENSRAAIITRGFAEMVRLAVAKGGRAETLTGLSGLGDLLLTCGSIQSRNMSFGLALGEGKTKEEVLAGRGRGATEGVTAAESVSRLGRKCDVSMPICDAVYRILYEDVPVDDAIKTLLERPFSSENNT